MGPDSRSYKGGQTLWEQHARSYSRSTYVFKARIRYIQITFWKWNELYDWKGKFVGWHVPTSRMDIAHLTQIFHSFIEVTPKKRSNFEQWTANLVQNIKGINFDQQNLNREIRYQNNQLMSIERHQFQTFWPAEIVNFMPRFFLGSWWFQSFKIILTDRWIWWISVPLNPPYCPADRY